LAVVALVMCTEAEAPGAMLPRVQFRVCVVVPVMAQLPGPEYAGLTDQLTPDPAGSGSDSVTPVAVPVPEALEFETETVNPIGEPALTLGASADFVMLSAGARTLVTAVELIGVGMLVALAVAVLVYVPALAEVVALVMCTEADAPGAMLPRVQFRVCVVVPVIAQLPGPEYAGLTDQLMPDPPGSGSDIETEFAVAVPAALEFETVTVKPIAEPALTLGASAVLTMLRPGPMTLVIAVELTGVPPLVS
jgi:hypothetical protein